MTEIYPLTENILISRKKKEIIILMLLIFKGTLNIALYFTDENGGDSNLLINK